MVKTLIAIPVHLVKRNIQMVLFVNFFGLLEWIVYSTQQVALFKSITVIIALVCNWRILIQSALHAPSPYEVDSLGMYNPLVSGFSRGNWKV
jgi:hypothetical protein